MIRILLALWGGLAGAIFLGSAFAMAGAQVSRLLSGVENVAIGAEAGLAGLAAGFVAGVWLVLRQNGHWGGTAVTGLTVGALFMIGCLGFVAFS
ncbi:MAG: hypothetical protein JSR24_12615 [Proteobacteria bacterium]|nr:hypothetical protein [Pseudomonadota bacterium]